MVTKFLLDKEKITSRLEDIKNAISKLEKYQNMSFEEFSKDEDYFSLASYWLRIAMEAVLTIGIHILSRLPSNGKKKSYTQVILSLGDYEVIPMEFAKKIKGIAGYRNRLVHLYWQVKPEDLYKAIDKYLKDLSKFNNYIKIFLKKYNDEFSTK